MEQFAARGFRDECDEVRGGGVEECKRRGVFLGVRLVGIITEGFEAEHGDDVFVIFPAFFCIDGTAHIRGLEEGGFFVYKEEEAESEVGLF